MKTMKNQEYLNIDGRGYIFDVKTEYWSFGDGYLKSTAEISEIDCFRKLIAEDGERLFIEITNRETRHTAMNVIKTNRRYTDENVAIQHAEMMASYDADKAECIAFMVKLNADAIRLAIKPESITFGMVKQGSFGIECHHGLFIDGVYTNMTVDYHKGEGYSMNDYNGNMDGVIDGFNIIDKRGQSDRYGYLFWFFNKFKNMDAAKAALADFITTYYQRKEPMGQK